MIIHRTNPISTARPAKSGASTSVMERHVSAQGAAPPAPPPSSPPAAPPPKGDVIYGARAIAKFIFDDDSNTARRRVFNLWTHYRGRKEKAGFFKLKGALCLSKSQWLAFHGLA